MLDGPLNGLQLKSAHSFRSMWPSTAESYSALAWRVGNFAVTIFPKRKRNPAKQRGVWLLANLLQRFRRHFDCRATHAIFRPQ